MAKIELEDGPDPVEILKHQKKMLTALEYNRRNTTGFPICPERQTTPILPDPAVERMLISGNQTGKSSALAFETAMHCLGGPYHQMVGRRPQILPREPARTSSARIRSWRG